MRERGTSFINSTSTCLTRVRWCMKECCQQPTNSLCQSTCASRHVPWRASCNNRNAAYLLCALDSRHFGKVGVGCRRG